MSTHMEVAALYWPVECRHEGLLGRAALPNQHYPSDHLPIGALLRLKVRARQCHGKACAVTLT